MNILMDRLRGTGWVVDGALKKAFLFGSLQLAIAAFALFQSQPCFAGVYRVADIYSGASSSTPSYLTVLNNELYFQADGNDGAGTELWKCVTVGGEGGNQRAVEVKRWWHWEFP